MKSVNSNNKNTNSVQTANALLLGLYYVLASVYVPLCAFLDLDVTVVSFISLAVCVLGVAVMTRAAGTFKAVLGYAVILGAFIFLGGNLLAVGMFSAFATAVCIFAHLQLNFPSPFIWGLPAIALIVTLLVTRSLAASVISLAALPAAIALTGAIKEKAAKVSSICRISFGICISVAAVFLCAVYTEYGSVSFELCRQAIDTAREVTVEFVKLTAEQMESMMETSFMAFEDENIAYAVSVIFNVLPAIVIIVANVVSYVIHSMFLSIRFISLEDKKQALPMLSFEMSLASAIVFLVSLVITFVSSLEGTVVWGAVAQNVMLILVPGLILTALAGIRMLTVRKGPSCLGTLVYMGSIFLIATLSPVVIISASVLGAILIIITNIAKAKAEKNKI